MLDNNLVFLGSGLGFSDVGSLIGFSGSGFRVFRFLDLGRLFQELGFVSFCLLIQRCKILWDAKELFDQYSVLPDEREICTMNDVSTMKMAADRAHLARLEDVQPGGQLLFMPFSYRDGITLYVDRITPYIFDLINVNDVGSMHFYE